MPTSIDPNDLPIRDRYKLLIGCIGPRPIALVSTISPAGVANVAPFSFFSGIGSNPMTLMFCPSNGEHGEEKDTLRYAKPTSEGGTGQFVVNVSSMGYIDQVAGAAEPLPPDQSEFDLTGLTREPSETVAPPRVAESPVAFECETMQVVRTNPGAPAGGNIVIGRVLHIRAHEGVFNERLHADAAVLDLVGRMGGMTYCTTRERFDLPRGKPALDETPPTA